MFAPVTFRLSNIDTASSAIRADRCSGIDRNQSKQSWTVWSQQFVVLSTLTVFALLFPAGNFSNVSIARCYSVFRKRLHQIPKNGRYFRFFRYSRVSCLWCCIC
ncbi:unnamed protein product [Cylicocyclus nassatus]|uniref:Uncharacterized protein n=1 Tax=Cylicocyclus nassatus TaxID=53992 RepID=A0AA36DN55_CYLNA|nr:unnamed protein product [Cylicocyclus nassatus]